MTKDRKIGEIIAYLETLSNRPDMKTYQDEGFIQYIQDIKNGKSNKVLYPSNPVYRTQFDIVVLMVGNYECVQTFLENASAEEQERFWQDLDFRVLEIQTALIAFCKEQREHQGINYTSTMQKLYCNFLENFAPQRLVHYTTPPVNVEMLKGMQTLQKESLNAVREADAAELSDKLVDFNSLYQLDAILELTDLYQELLQENDLQKQIGIWQKIDALTQKGIALEKNSPAMMNFLSPMCVQTMNDMIDNMVIKLNHYKEKANISEDFNVLLKKYSQIKQIYPLETIYSSNSIFHKLLQVSMLEILPEKEKRQLEEYLNKEFDRQNIPDTDMTKFDEKMKTKEPFSIEEVEEFYKAVIHLTIKEGIMPMKYNEFLIARLIEENPTFTNGLSDDQKSIISEYFARNISRKLLDDKNYITFSSHFHGGDAENAVMLGQHCAGVTKIRPIDYERQSFETVLSIITIFHELRHEQQHRSLHSRKYDYLVYILGKEKIFKQKDQGYYDRNYDTMYEELDAEQFALRRASKFLETIPLDESFRQSDTYQIMLKHIHERKSKNEGGFQKAKTKGLQDGKMVDVDNAFDGLIKQHPEVLQERPFLRIEYRADGTPKPVTQIFNEFILTIGKIDNKMGIYDIYKNILLSKARRNIEDCKDIANIPIPENLTPVTRRALKILKEKVLSKTLDEPSIEEK